MKAAWVFSSVAVGAGPRSLSFPSHTIVHAAPAQFVSARLRGVLPVDFSQGLFTLAAPARRGRTPAGARKGSVESAPVLAAHPFQELIASGNADLPSGTGFGIEIQVRFLDGTWSPWYAIGRLDAEGGGGSVPKQEDARAQVDVDTLKLKEPADAFRYRVTLQARKAGQHPVLRLVAVTYTDTSSPVSLESRHVLNSLAVDWDVPRRSQMTEQARYARDICSPTSVGMVLSYWKRKVSTAEAVRGAYDHAAKIYGNWFLNTAYAGTRGLEAYVTRFNSVEGLEAEVRSGYPVVISLSFGPGELTGAPIRKTNGHLLVVRGFDRHGNVIVNDPAAPRTSDVRRVYRREEFARAWLGHKMGVAYRIRPLWPKDMVVGVPFTHLRSLPKAFSGRPRDPVEESQILYGERVRVVGVRREWAQALAMEQEHWEKGKGWGPYAGWVRVRDLLPAGQSSRPNAVVHDKFTELEIAPAKKGGRPRTLRLSVGTRLLVLEPGRDLTNLPTGVTLGEGPEGRSLALVPGEGVGTVLSKSLQPAREETFESGRGVILDTARLFLGDRYFWGGRVASSAAGRQGGVDCSGLVSLSYRVAGLDVPRNAQDQYLKSRRIQREDLKPGDLVFLSEKGAPRKIIHVMIYSGEGGLIEAVGDKDVVREISAEERFGRPWDQIDSGQVLGGRTMYFGTFF